MSRAFCWARNLGTDFRFPEPCASRQRDLCQSVSGMWIAYLRNTYSDILSVQIMLLREVLEADPKDRIIQLCAETVLDLCLQCATAKMGVEYGTLPSTCSVCSKFHLALSGLSLLRAAICTEIVERQSSIFSKRSGAYLIPSTYLLACE